MLMPFPPASGSSSPWGPVQTVEPLGPDVVSVTTASHGGLRLSPTALARLPAALRATAPGADGWFEEDCEWALAYLALGLDAFEPDAARAAEVHQAAVRTVERFQPQHAALLGLATQAEKPMAEQPLSAPAVGEVAGAVEPFATDPAAEARERLALHGPKSLDEGETLALLLAHRLRPWREAATLAEVLIRRFGGLGRILGAAQADLARVAGADVAHELGLLHALLLAALEHPLRRRPVLSSWSAVSAYLRAALAASPREAFHVLFLDRRNQLIADERMGEGTVDHAPAYPREIVRRALELSASALVIAHNHPSGDPTPSGADVEMTRQVAAAAQALNITVHDHFIVGGAEVASLKGLGLM